MEGVIQRLINNIDGKENEVQYEPQVGDIIAKAVKSLLFPYNLKRLLIYGRNIKKER